MRPRQRHLRRMIATHAMHSSTRRSRRGANINIACRCGVMSPCRSKKELPKIHGSAPDIASYQVRIHALEIRGRKDVTRQNTFAEAGSETLDLILQLLKHAYVGAVWNMTIGPCCVLADWSPRAIEKTGLD